MLVKAGLILLKAKGAGIVATKIAAGIFGAGVLIGATNSTSVMQIIHQVFHF